MRIGLSYVNNETGDRVPFYFLPYVGGSDTVRGFREFRFRDENILFLNAEYRIRVHRFLHVAPFFDAGEVRADWEDIGPGDLRTSYGDRLPRRHRGPRVRAPRHRHRRRRGHARLLQVRAVVLTGPDASALIPEP